MLLHLAYIWDQRTIMFDRPTDRAVRGTLTEIWTGDNLDPYLSVCLGPLESI